MKDTVAINWLVCVDIHAYIHTDVQTYVYAHVHIMYVPVLDTEHKKKKKFKIHDCALHFDRKSASINFVSDIRTCISHLIGFCQLCRGQLGCYHKLDDRGCYHKLDDRGCYFKLDDRGCYHKPDDMLLS